MQDRVKCFAQVHIDYISQSFLYSFLKIGVIFGPAVSLVPVPLSNILSAFGAAGSHLLDALVVALLPHNLIFLKNLLFVSVQFLPKNTFPHPP